MDIDKNVVDSLNMFGLLHHKNWNEGRLTKIGKSVLNKHCWQLTLLNIEKKLYFTFLYIKTNSEH